MSDITYCANRCTSGPDKRRRTTKPPSQLCGPCETDLHRWLTAIPQNYALLPQFINHGTAEKNPDSKATKRAEAPAPMRLEVIDLLDTRLGRKWLGTAPADDRRGILGTLQSHVDHLRDERSLAPSDPTVATACALLDRHRLWLAEQDWIDELYADVKAAHRSIADAIGDYRRPPVGRCHIATDDDPACGGPLFANTYGGVRCAKCKAEWDADHLRQLGLAQAAAQQEGA